MITDKEAARIAARFGKIVQQALHSAGQDGSFSLPEDALRDCGVKPDSQAFSIILGCFLGELDHGFVLSLGDSTVNMARLCITLGMYVASQAEKEPEAGIIRAVQ